MPNERPAAPWLPFLSDLDERLREDVDLHCIGGFVVRPILWLCKRDGGLGRPGRSPGAGGETDRGPGRERISAPPKASRLRRVCRVACFPDSYESRLIRAFPLWSRLKLWALEAHDLALTKLERSNDRDLQDVMYLAQSGFLKRETLIERYRSEMRPYLSGPTPTWHDTTLEMWVNACWPA